MMDASQFRSLLGRFEKGESTPREEAVLREYFADPANEPEIAELFMADLAATPFGPPVDPARWQPLVDRILDRVGMALQPDTQIPQTGSLPRIRRNIRRWAAAAAILVILAGAATWWLVSRREQTPITSAMPTQSQRFRNDVDPGGNHATLKLANGSTIFLDSVANGPLTKQGATRIQKLSGNQLIYKTSTPITGQPQTFNTLSTPRGGQYRLSLPDGTKVWLDAASSITYPTAFTGKERKITITGEAYLEVARDPARPFIVQQGDDLRIQVLGTRFNINAYADEDAATITLLQGSVKIVTTGSEKILAPGNEAIAANSRITMATADTVQAIAWKEGRFAFHDADIGTIMRQASRWYGIDVRYAGRPTQHFVGDIPRDLPLSRLLQLLELTGRVHFAIEGKNVTVSP